MKGNPRGTIQHSSPLPSGHTDFGLHPSCRYPRSPEPQSQRSGAHRDRSSTPRSQDYPRPCYLPGAQHRSRPSLPPAWHLGEQFPAGLSGWTGKPGTGRFMPRKGEEAPGKRQFRSAGKEQTPNLTSLKTRKRKTVCHLNPNVLLTYLSYLDNSQNLLKHEEK